MKRLSTFLFVAGFGFVGAGQPGLAQETRPGPCRPDIDICVEDELPATGRAGEPVPISNQPSNCVWDRPQLTPQYTRVVLEQFNIAWPPPSEDAYLIQQTCDGRITTIEWVAPNEPAPTPDELAQALYARLERNLPVPVVVSDPAFGEPSIISVPTFVAVENWTGTVTDEECDPSGVLCVGVTATPSLSFLPGEPGAATVACAGSGSRFVESGEDSSAQASVPGACAYAYRLRTGADSRPEAWPGVVTVTWELTWSSTSGLTSALPDISKSAAAPRAVTEVQTVIEG